MDHDMYVPTAEKTHPVLYIPEILLEIFTSLSTTDLVEAAQTCKAWAGPALDVRWRTRMIKLSRLLSILAPLVNVNAHLTSFTLQYEKMTLIRWVDFVERFAGKVTWLELSIALDLGSLVLIERLLARFGGPLCRNLSRIDTGPCPQSGSNDRRTPLLEFLLSSNLREVKLPMNSYRSTTRANLTLLGRRTPQILDLTVSGDDTFNYAIFTNLRSLSHHGYLSLAHYIVLASLPHLRTLLLFHISISNAQHNDGSIITFPALREFSMSEISMELEGAIERSATPALQILYFTTSIGRRLTLLDRVLQASPLLEYLDVNVDVSPRKLKLKRHEHIQKFKLIDFAHGGYDWEDDDLDWIHNSFPRLQDLTIRDSYH
ncbi:hypothetical protein FRB94_008171 [Tulasnella sp. JGI-2019a]|nr:hypothetical protein FRB93_006295 [Tulasnella sp. JGI-2019a]KAG8996639.1 hypothetical protein FRB94_008171 [Tulasnella sp. JGI-2019a]